MYLRGSKFGCLWHCRDVPDALARARVRAPCDRPVHDCAMPNVTRLLPRVACVPSQHSDTRPRIATYGRSRARSAVYASVRRSTSRPTCAPSTSASSPSVVTSVARTLRLARRSSGTSRMCTFDPDRPSVRTLAATPFRLATVTPIEQLRVLALHPPLRSPTPEMPRMLGRPHRRGLRQRACRSLPHSRSLPRRLRISSSN